MADLSLSGLSGPGTVLAIVLVLFWPFTSSLSKITSWLHQDPSNLNSYTKKGKKNIKQIRALSEQHEVAAVLGELIHKDGAGSWPPRANHEESTWPQVLRAYKEIYLEMAPLLPQEKPSLDHAVNIARIATFRNRFRDLLNRRVDLGKVMQLLQAADAGRWDTFPRDVYNAFYCCIASSRHAYRWATVPVVQVAQLEKEIDLPVELIEPWVYMQRHFGCASESGNNMSNLVLNFDSEGHYIHRINTNMAPIVTKGEESFARIFHSVEVLGLPIYHAMVLSIITFSRGDTASCARHVSTITSQLRFVLNSYFDNLHDDKIARSVWLSHVQGFYAWGVGNYDDSTGEYDKFDGLSGNQVLLFQALDAWLGIEQYLSQRDQERNVPVRQRALCQALAKHSFRGRISENTTDIHEAQIFKDFTEIVKRLRLFRHAHRTRAKVYLSQPAPERLPMTAGKSLLEPTIDQSLEFLDGFMVRRIAQTV